jgi:hypothetical protein
MLEQVAFTLMLTELCLVEVWGSRRLNTDKSGHIVHRVSWEPPVDERGTMNV